MGNKAFKISFYIFIISIVSILTLNLKGVISFGVDAQNSLSEIIIFFIIVISIFIFRFMNKNVSEKITINIIRLIMISLMFIIINFLIEDLLKHNSSILNMYHK